MSNNEQNEDPKENDVPENEQAEGLTAEQAAEARPYDEMEAWKKSKNTLFAVLGVIALCVAISSSIIISSRKKPLKEVYDL